MAYPELLVEIKFANAGFTTNNASATNAKMVV